PAAPTIFFADKSFTRYPASTMRLLDRYLFRELLTPLAYCLGGFLIFWISYDLFTELDELQAAKLHTLDILCYTLAMTPEFLVQVLPIALLLALLYTLANHARFNEITAMRAAGISLWRICLPYFAVGLAASAIYFALNEIVVPRSMDWANKILARYVQKSADAKAQDQFRGFINAREHRLWRFDEYRVKTSEMINPQVNWKLPDGSSYQLNAARAIRMNGAWTFFNASEYLQTGTNASPAPLLETNVLAVPEFNETPREIRSEMKISGHRDFHGATQPDISLKDIFYYLRLHPNLPRDQSRKLLAELHSRLAAPWTCLVVVFIAIPFGAVSGRRNLFFGVAGSIAICFIYFVVQKISFAFGSDGDLPGWLAAWLPNLIFAATGLFLTARVR
ncbi:MAG TPA: LptF/LptG family permease, partial [Dongiaceae bacterium]|nr:LptF/LptG family permease [Dongiaceae bacterium]